MRLSAGSKLGPYEIVSPIGAGGMGEVYRARDTRLGREVAIKVLPAGKGTDDKALSRFEREAQAIAALSHPNILAIHDYGHDDDVVYTVSELLEGATLGERLASGALPLRKAIETGTKIAHGLAAAHGRGVVHRDLKPENVFLTQDGQVKILDFGLAKFGEPEPEPDALAANDRTMTRAPGYTDPGTVMGTVGYMSPEQVRGLPTDHRSDIFTLGAILYEMISGHRAFAGETPADTSSAILNQEPAELSELDREVPPSVEMVIHHCMEKNPEERFQSARDLAFALDRLSTASVVTGPVTAEPPAQPRSRSGLIAVLALIAIVAAAAGAYLIGKGSGADAVPSFQRLTFRNGSIRSACIAPDGQTMVYGAAWDGDPIRVFTTRPGSPQSRQLDIPDADILAVSSRGELAISVGRTFLSPNQSTGTLARVPLDGGAPRQLLVNVQEADWSPDGEELAVVHEVAGANRLEYPIGNLLYETRGWISWPRVSPDGQRVAFLDHDLRWDNGGWVSVIDLQGNRRRLTERWPGAEGLAWAPDGDEIWFTASPGGTPRGIRAVTLSGEVRVVHRQATDLSLFDLLPGGRALVGSTNMRREARFGSGGEERDLSWLDWSLTTFLTRDGSTVLINEQGQGGELDYSIYLRGTDGSTPMHVGSGIPTSISPDGNWVMARTSDQDTHWLVLYPTGPGTPRVVAELAQQTWGAWFPDSRHIIYFSGGARGEAALYVHELDGETRQLPYDSFGITAFSDPVSPDGERFVARSRAGPFFLLSVDGSEPQPIAGLRPADSPLRFSDDGRWLYFYRQGMPALYGRVEWATGRREELGELAPEHRAGAVGVWPVLISGDGEEYVYSYPRFLTDLFIVDDLH